MENLHYKYFCRTKNVVGRLGGGAYPLDSITLGVQSEASPAQTKILKTTENDQQMAAQ